MPADILTFDQLAVGREWLSVPRDVTATDLQTYSALTNDDDPADGEPEPPAGTDRARGLFGPAVATGLATACPPVRTIAFLAIRGWQFLHPILAGDVVHIRNRVDGITPRGVGRRAEVTWRVEMVNQRGEVVQTGTTVTLVDGPARPARN
jgi:3-hydroxybutyryl-CoA dehydratase